MEDPFEPIPLVVEDFSEYWEKQKEMLLYKLQHVYGFQINDPEVELPSGNSENPPPN